MSMTPEEDAQARLTAAKHFRSLSAHDALASRQLLAGFEFAGTRLPAVNPRAGIFKPKALRYLLSVRTVFPKVGAKVWYDDQRLVHRQIEQGEDLIDYAFQGTDPDKYDNRLLKEAMLNQVPILYFLGIAPGRYTLHFPTYIVDWNATSLSAKLAFGAPIEADSGVPDAAERKYALRLVRQRLHQAQFREAVLSAYGNKCAITRLPEPRLLDAAHIVPDSDDLGLPIVANGLPLSKVHHAAFDANLIGIDADYRIHVSDALMAINDGPMFEQGIKQKHGTFISLPNRSKDYPDRDRLALRFEAFSYAQ